MPCSASRNVSDFIPNAARPALGVILGWGIVWVQVVQRNCTLQKIGLPEDEGSLKERESCQDRGPCMGRRCSGRAALAGCSLWGPYRPAGWLQSPVAAQELSQQLAQLTWASPAAGTGLAGVELVQVRVL